jgi:hypothetical protein
VWRSSIAWTAVDAPLSTLLCAGTARAANTILIDYSAWIRAVLGEGASYRLRWSKKMSWMVEFALLVVCIRVRVRPGIFPTTRVLHNANHYYTGGLSATCPFILVAISVPWCSDERFQQGMDHGYIQRHRLPAPNRVSNLGRYNNPSENSLTTPTF